MFYYNVQTTHLHILKIYDLEFANDNRPYGECDGKGYIYFALFHLQTLCILAFWELWDCNLYMYIHLWNVLNNVNHIPKIQLLLTLKTLEKLSKYFKLFKYELVNKQIILTQSPFYDSQVFRPHILACRTVEVVYHQRLKAVLQGLTGIVDQGVVHFDLPLSHIEHIPYQVETGQSPLYGPHQIFHQLQNGHQLKNN